MSRRPNLTEAEKAAIAELAESGVDYDEIARRHHCTRGSVSWCALRAGVIRPGFRPLERRGTYARGGHQVRPYTAAEDRQIVAWDLERLSHSEIGRRLDRAPNSITGRLATLARREAAQEEARA